MRSVLDFLRITISFSINDVILPLPEDAMIDKDVVIELIREVFDGNVYPGDAFLQGSFEGCEPNEEVGFFMGKMDWKILDAGMLDSHYSALNFFSEAGFRFFIPAYLSADLQDGLRTADPLFHLTGGFYVLSALQGRSYLRQEK